MSSDEINRVIEAHINYILESFFKKASRRFKKDYWIEEPPKIIEKATKLSDTGIPTLESVKAVIKEIEDDYEQFEKKLQEKKGGGAWIIVGAIWVVITFLLALAINLAYWGAVISHLGKNYWETLFSDGLWTFLVGGFGAIVIIYLFFEGDIL